MRLNKANQYPCGMGYARARMRTGLRCCLAIFLRAGSPRGCGVDRVLEVDLAALETRILNDTALLEPGGHLMAALPKQGRLAGVGTWTHSRHSQYCGSKIIT